MSNKKAFTLAEVLITLGIIGIVAALTIPTLIDKYKKMVFTNKVKYVYNIVSNALMSSVAENGPPNTWDYGSSINNDGSSNLQDPLHTKEMVKKYFTPYFKIIKEDNDNKSGAYYIVINNGITLTFFTDGGTNSEGIYTPTILYAVASFNNDTSSYGSKTRDYSQKDVFMTISVSNYAKVNFFNWGDSTRTGIINERIYGCRKEIVKNKRYGCAALIQHDGWEIKDDYPW